MTVAGLLGEVDSRELTAWMAFYRAEAAQRAAEAAKGG